jgi:hypothetical protein
MEQVTDSLVFSVHWDNYQNNILHDKSDRTLGAWEITLEKQKDLKYAYVFLKNSEKTIVKKYEIEKFEQAQLEKGFNRDWTYCLIFKKSEDVFFEYPYSHVQARHYRNSEELDSLPRLNEEEIKRRLEKSKNTPFTSYHSDTARKQRVRLSRSDRPSRIKQIKETSKDKLHKAWFEKFNFRKLKDIKDATILLQKVELGADPEQVLTEYFQSFASDKKKVTQ